MCLEIVYDG